MIESNGHSRGSARIAVLGLGYVGSVTAAGFAELGHQVIGVDLDEYKVRTVLAGKAPFFEPGLEELISAHVAAGRLTATIDIGEALPKAEICFICVGTPSAEDKDVALDALRRVCSQIAEKSSGRSTPLTVVIRSTIFPGTCEETVYRILPPGPCLHIVVNPEFLREGNAVGDFLKPSLVVVGSDNSVALESVAQLYANLPVEVSRVSLRTAEMIKYACNAFHAVKIAFANEMGALCQELHLAGQEVMATLCKDMKLNISPAYLRPGFAFGGSCLPKDLRALEHRAARLDINLPLIQSVLASNAEHLRRLMQIVDELPAQRIGIFGLAFKENTDDLRESPVVSLLEHLLAKRRQVRVFDPHVQLDRIYGSNRKFMLSSIPHTGSLLLSSLEGLLVWADHIVLTQEPGCEAAAEIMRSGLPVLNAAQYAQVFTA